jgi:hypothetical protein
MSDTAVAAQASAAEQNTDTGAPVDARSPATSSEPPRKLSLAERKAELVRRLREGKEAKRAERQQQEPAAEAKPDEPAKADADKSEVKADDKPEKPVEKKAEPDRDIELRAAKLARELKDAKADALEFKPKAEKFDALTGKIEKAKGDPYAVVNMLPELFGMDFGQMAEFVLKNQDKFQESKKFADLPPDVREEIELARKERVERQAREKEAAEHKARADKFSGYKSKLSEYLSGGGSEDYPLVSSLGWAVDQAALKLVQEDSRDAHAVLRKMEADAKEHFSDALSNEKLIKALVSNDKELRAKIANALGFANESNKSPPTGASLQNGAPKSERQDGPLTLTNRSTSSDTAASTSGRSSKSERKQKIAEAFRAAQFARR